MRNMIMEPVTRVREGEEEVVGEKEKGGGGYLSMGGAGSWKRCKESKRGKVWQKKTEGREVAEGETERLKVQVGPDV